MTSILSIEYDWNHKQNNNKREEKMKNEKEKTDVNEANKSSNKMNEDKWEAMEDDEKEGNMENEKEETDANGADKSSNKMNQDKLEAMEDDEKEGDMENEKEETDANGADKSSNKMYEDILEAIRSEEEGEEEERNKNKLTKRKGTVLKRLWDAAKAWWPGNGSKIEKKNQKKIKTDNDPERFSSVVTKDEEPLNQNEEQRKNTSEIGERLSSTTDLAIPPKEELMCNKGHIHLIENRMLECDFKPFRCWINHEHHSKEAMHDCNKRLRLHLPVQKPAVPKPKHDIESID